MSVSITSNLDKWVKCISTSGTIRAVAITATESSQFLSSRHQLSAAGSKSLAESIIAGLLLSSYCKTGEKVNLNIQGSGNCSTAIVDANSEGQFRGYVVERDPTQIQIGRGIGPWGIGLFSVLRTKHEESQPYIGTVPLLTGHLAKDLSFYWLQSEQVNSAVGIEVFMDEHGKIKMAEGFLIQALPGATEADITFIENHLKRLQEIDSNNTVRSSPVQLLSFILENQTFTVLEETPLTVSCPCTVDRVKRSLTLIGSEELTSMADENKDFQINCDFCSEVYSFTPEQIRQLIQ
jgi:molecular chaperone Hsp33